VRRAHREIERAAGELYSKLRYGRPTTSSASAARVPDGLRGADLALGDEISRHFLVPREGAVRDVAEPCAARLGKITLFAADAHR
jgi:hypothetical protein